ncbi:hypothetical protein [Neobacillus mesonae]|uniref:hypothetical protein n=1 Tax=Neobacillus mesonae TaxID=1193713 RepID=UPI002E239466|nr:hypothetical protein [Neobacillus mesonae]
MFKRLAVLLSFLLVFGLFSENPALAKGATTLTTKDLTMWKIKPNDSASSAIKKLKKTFKQLDFDKVDSSYITGDPTPQMAYYLELYTDSKGRVIGMDYEHFKAKNKGLNFNTNKGLKIGSSIQTVYKKYGKRPNVKYDKDPGNNYIFLSYPIVLKETKQAGTLTIKTRYGKKSKRSAAKVYGFDYKLKPLKKKKTSNDGILGGAKEYTWHGVTVKAGMTKRQIIALLGRPNEIREPLGGTPEQRAAVKERLGEKQFNFMDIEQWTYIRQVGDHYEAVVVDFNYKDAVSEILRVY